MMIPRIVGHRGAAGLFPENTLEGFRKAAGLGVKCVELDVHVSADNVPVVTHNERCKIGNVSERNSSPLRLLGISSLEDTLTLLSDLGVMAIVEIKGDPGEGAMQAINEVIRPFDCVVSSFSQAVLSRVEGKPVYLNGFEMPEIPDFVAGVVVSYQNCRKYPGKCAGAFTVNDISRAETLFSAGVDFIITDRPDLFL